MARRGGLGGISPGIGPRLCIGLREGAIRGFMTRGGECGGDCLGVYVGMRVV